MLLLYIVPVYLVPYVLMLADDDGRFVLPQHEDVVRKVLKQILFGCQVEPGIGVWIIDINHKSEVEAFMYRLSDSRMGEYGFLEFIDRITVLDGDTGNDDDLRRRISQQVATDDSAVHVCQELA